MTAHVQNFVIDRFLMLYGTPNTDNVDGFFREYIRALSGFPADVLDRGISRVIEEHEFASWPTVGTCVKACRRLIPEPVPQFPKDDRDLPPPTPEAKARCRALAAELRATVGLQNIVTGQLGGPPPATNRDAWNARVVVGVSRYGDPIRKPKPAA